MDGAGRVWWRSWLRGGRPAVVVPQEHLTGDPLSERDPARAQRARPSRPRDVAYRAGQGVRDGEVLLGHDVPLVSMAGTQHVQRAFERRVADLAVRGLPGGSRVGLVLVEGVDVVAQ